MEQNQFTHLIFQICSHLRFSECFEIYKDLIKNTQDDYEAERETNLSAVVACLSMEGTVRVFFRISQNFYNFVMFLFSIPQKTNLPLARDDSYELAYNESIRLLGEGKTAEAESQLRGAETLCRKSLEEDGATEEEIEDELALIR